MLQIMHCVHVGLYPVKRPEFAGCSGTVYCKVQKMCENVADVAVYYP